MGGVPAERLAWAAGQLVAAAPVLFTLFFVAPGADLSVSGSFAAGHGEGRAGRFQETESSAPASERCTRA